MGRKYVKRSQWPDGCPRHVGTGRNPEGKCRGCEREKQKRFYDKHRERLLADARRRNERGNCATTKDDARS